MMSSCMFGVNCTCRGACRRVFGCAGASQRFYSAIAKLPDSYAMLPQYVAPSSWRFLVPGGGVRLGVSDGRCVLTILTGLKR